MSEPVTKRQPMIDLEEFERRLRRPRPMNQMDGEPLAELIHLFRGHEILDAGQPSAQAREDASTEAEAQSPLIGGDFAEIEAALLAAQRAAGPLATTEANAEPVREAEAEAPLISGDFSEIEAGLLSALQQDAAPMSMATGAETFLPITIDAPDYLRDVNETMTSRLSGAAEVRSRRPLYFMAAIVLAGIGGVAGLAIHSGSKRDVPAQPEVATIKAQPGAAKFAAPETDAADAGNASSTENAATQDASNLAPSPQSFSTAGIAGQEKTPRVIALTEPTGPAASEPVTEAPSILAPPAPSFAAPVEGAAAIEPKRVKTASVRPDGSVISQDAALQDFSNQNAPPKNSIPKASLPKDATAHAAAKAAPLPVPREASAAKTPAAKAAAHATTTAKPSATAALTGGPQPAHKANADAAKPASATDAKPAQVVDAGPVAAPPSPKQPASGGDGPFGIVNSAVNSITGATSKLLDWGKTGPQ
ncbi:MAG: hypothetical protein WDN46_03970 [Methylocella sp.]